MMIPLLTLFSGVLGVLIGSFLNVVIWRVPRDESLLTPSHCPRCASAIKPWQNIPVISWIVLGGKCRTCRERISVRYPLIEIVTGVVFALVAWWWLANSQLEEMIKASLGLQAVDPGWGEQWLMQLAGSILMLVVLWWFASITVALTIIDIEHQRLPDRIVLPSTAVLLVVLIAAILLLSFSGDNHLTFGGWALPVLLRTIGGAVALFVFYFVIVLIYPAGMGGGDVKLAPTLGAMLGFFGGWWALIVGTFVGFALGALWGIILMILKQAGRKTAIPFGPFMLAGAWVGITIGNDAMGWYLQIVGLA